MVKGSEPFGIWLNACDISVSMYSFTHPYIPYLALRMSFIIGLFIVHVHVLQRSIQRIIECQDEDYFYVCRSIITGIGQSQRPFYEFLTLSI